MQVVIAYHSEPLSAACCLECTAVAMEMANIRIGGVMGMAIMSGL